MPTVTQALQKNPERGQSYWGGILLPGAAIGTGAAGGSGDDCLLGGQK